jgi:hypothetical protein
VFNSDGVCLKIVHERERERERRGHGLKRGGIPCSSEMSGHQEIYRCSMPLSPIAEHARARVAQCKSVCVQIHETAFTSPRMSLSTHSFLSHGEEDALAGTRGGDIVHKGTPFPLDPPAQLTLKVSMWFSRVPGPRHFARVRYSMGWDMSLLPPYRPTRSHL